MFVQGKVYCRRDLHDTYGGQWQGGISTPAGQPFIFLFSSPKGKDYGYEDEWIDEDLFLYTGEGQQGDMEFVRGNRAIRDHVRDGKELHLFEYVRTGHVRYIGQMICTGYDYRQGLDMYGCDRTIIMFELESVGKINIS